MKGHFFAQIVPDPQVQNRMNVRTGIVKDKVGADCWLLEFRTPSYKFSNVVESSKLQPYAFFATEAEQQAFLGELMQAQVGRPAPPQTEVPSTPVSEASL